MAMKSNAQQRAFPVEQTTASEPVLFGLGDAERILGLSRTTLLRLVGQHRLDARRVGRRVLVTAKSVRELVAGLPRVGVAPSEILKAEG